MDKFNKKFKFQETFTNESNKTSGSGFIGVIMGLVASAAFVAGVIGWYLGNTLIIEYLDQVIKFGGLAALLLGIRKASTIWDKSGNGVETAKPKPAMTPTNEKG